MPGAVLGVGNAAVNKLDKKIFPFEGYTLQGGR